MATKVKWPSAAKRGVGAYNASRNPLSNTGTGAVRGMSNPTSYTLGGQKTYNSPGWGSYMNQTGASPSTPAVKVTPGTTSKAPAAPSPVNTNPLIEGVFNDTVTDLGTARDNTIIGINEDTGATANDYGFGFTNGNFDPKQTLSVDPQNPFSKMALLQRSYEQAKLGTTNSYAAQGQLYSGAVGAAQDENSWNRSQGNDSLRRAFQQVLRTGGHQVAAAGDTYRAGYGGAARDRLNTYLGSG